MHQTHRAGTDATLEERVDVIEKNLALANERINQTQQEIDAHACAAAAAVKQEQDARIAEDRAVREKLEATGTGGVTISFMGAIWLFVGVTLSTASLEISQWLK